MADTASVFSIPVRVYYEDTDSGGVVYYANYLKFMERARTEFLRHIGLELDELAARDKVQFVVRSATLDYTAAARFNALLSVTAEVVEAGRASVVFTQNVIEGDKTLCRGTIKLACVNTETFRPARIPDGIVGRLSANSESR